MSKYAAAFFIICFTAFHPLLAQDADSEARLALAKEVMKLTRATEAVEKMVPSLVQQQMQMIEARGGQDALTTDQKAAVETAIDNFMSSFSDAFPPFMDEMAKLYAGKFSLEDLTALRDFYQSDVGKRFVAGGIELGPQLAQASQAWAATYIIPAAQKMSTELQAALAKPS